ncbi:MAG: VWA domain-containing protein [Bacteroidia bacterium]
MYRFEHTEYFYAFIVLGVLLVLAIFNYNAFKKKVNILGDKTSILRLMPLLNLRKKTVKLILILFALVALILGLANLQTGSKLVDVKRQGADLMVCLDVSNSMLAQDLTPNRLVRAKYALEKMIDNLEGDRLGLIIFAGEAYVQLPITSDYSAAKLFLNSINTDMVPVQGTDIGAALNKAAESFDDSPDKNKAIILITDGENHEPEAIATAEEIAKKDIMINAIGIGSDKGVPIPIIENGINKGYKKNSQGETVVTKLNANFLKDLANKGNGVFVHATQRDIGISAIIDKIDELDKAEIDTKMFTDYEDQFQWFLGLSLVLLVVELLIGERRNKWFIKLNSYLKGNEK